MDIPSFLIELSPYSPIISAISAIVSAVATVAVMGATIAYARYTKEQLNHYKEQDALKVKPKLMPTTIHREGKPILVISNVGLGPANKIEFRIFEDGIYADFEREGVDCPHKINYLPPGGEKEYSDIYPTIEPCYTVEIKGSYYDLLGNKIEFKEQYHPIEI